MRTHQIPTEPTVPPGVSPAMRARALWLLALLAGLAACTPPAPVDDHSPGVGPLDDPSGEVYTYVVDSFAIDPSNAVALTGFNLDGLFSGDDDVNGCGFVDAISFIDPDQNTGPRCAIPDFSCRGGVDNQLPRVVDDLDSLGPLSGYRARLAAAIATSARAYLVRVSGVQSLADDSGVTVAVYEGLPTFATGCDGVLPDREYLVARTALRDGGTTLDDARLRARGRIRAGRLDVFFGPQDRLALPPLAAPGAPAFSGMASDLPLRRLRLRVDLTATNGRWGNLGGAIPGRETLESLCASLPAYCTVFRVVAPSYLDLPPDPPLAMGGCYVNAQMPFGDVGAGLGFTLVRARIREDLPVSDARPAGACGG